MKQQTRLASSWVSEPEANFYEVQGYSKESLAFTGMSKWIRKLATKGLLSDAQEDRRLWSSLEFALEGENSTLLYNVLTKLDSQGFLDAVWDSSYEMAVRRTLLQLEKEARAMSRNANLRRAMVHLAYQHLHAKVASYTGTWLGLSNDYLGLVPSTRDPENKNQIIRVASLAGKLPSLEKTVNLSWDYLQEGRTSSTGRRDKEKRCGTCRWYHAHTLTCDAPGLSWADEWRLDVLPEHPAEGKECTEWMNAGKDANPDAVRRWEKAVKAYRRGLDALVKEANKCDQMLKSEGLGVADWGEELAKRAVTMRQDALTRLHEQADSEMGLSRV
jgi:hypothetical protein